jgi:hypothetical protein
MITRARFRVHRTLSILILAVGLVLMVGKIYADSEPGASPLLLIVLGSAWYLITRVRARARRA